MPCMKLELSPIVVIVVIHITMVGISIVVVVPRMVSVVIRTPAKGIGTGDAHDCQQHRSTAAFNTIRHMRLL